MLLNRHKAEGGISHLVRVMYISCLGRLAAAFAVILVIDIQKTPRLQ